MLVAVFWRHFCAESSFIMLNASNPKKKKWKENIWYFHSRWTQLDQHTSVAFKIDLKFAWLIRRHLIREVLSIRLQFVEILFFYIIKDRLSSGFASSIQRSTEFWRLEFGEFFVQGHRLKNHSVGLLLPEAIGPVQPVQLCAKSRPPSGWWGHRFTLQSMAFAPLF